VQGAFESPTELADMAITKISFWIGTSVGRAPSDLPQVSISIAVQSAWFQSTTNKIGLVHSNYRKVLNRLQIAQFSRSRTHASLVLLVHSPHCRYESGACESLEVECSKIPDHRHPLPPLSQSKDCLRYCNIFVIFVSLEAHEGLSHKYCCNLRIRASAVAASGDADGAWQPVGRGG
jgi:hypothetical protein